MRKIAGILLAAALVVPVGLSAQQPQGPGRGGMMARNAASIAVAHKQDLKLTDDQVTKISAIEKQLQEKNAPIQEKMRQAWGGGERPDFQNMTDEQRQAMRSLMQEIRTNNEAAQGDVEKVLNADQAKQLQDIMQQEMPMRRRPNG
jgi:Spy/CpxP family protein refolding chaperone